MKRQHSRLKADSASDKGFAAAIILEWCFILATFVLAFTWLQSQLAHLPGALLRAGGMA